MNNYLCKNCNRIIPRKSGYCLDCERQEKEKVEHRIKERKARTKNTRMVRGENFMGPSRSLIYTRR